MRYIETIKVVDGVMQNIDYHIRRMGCDLPLEYDFPMGVIKYRIIYDTQIVQQECIPYSLPTIRSLQPVVCDEIVYDKKYENRSLLNSLMEQRGECDDVMILRNGMITDSSFCNLVLEDETGLYTPATPLLKGTKRQKLLEERKIKEREIKYSDLKYYKKIYLINAMIELGEISWKLEL